MSSSLHICKTYKVEYADKCPLHGYSETEPFIDWLYRQDDYDGYISEDRTIVELDIPFLKAHLNDEEYGQTMKTILENMDKDLSYARLEIW